MSRIAFQRAFQELTDTEIETIMERAQTVEFPAGTVIMREGQKHSRIYVILDGEMQVVRHSRKGEEKEIAEPQGPGDTVGEMSFIDGMGASATLIALSDVVLKAIDPDMIADMMGADETFAGRFYHSLLYTMIRRLRVLDYKFTFPEEA